MKKTVFQHKDILEIFPDLSPRSLVSWAEKGLLTPKKDAAGRGSVRQYSFDNVIHAGIIRELIRMGLTFRDIKVFFVNFWKAKMKNLNYDCILLWQRETFRIPREHQPVIDNTKPGGEMFYSYNVRVFSTEEFKDSGGDAILAPTGEVGAENLLPALPLANMTSALIVNVAAIHSYVKDRLIS